MARPPNPLETVLRMLAELEDSALRLRDYAHKHRSREYFQGQADAFRNARELALTESEIIIIQENPCPPPST